MITHLLTDTCTTHENLGEDALGVLSERSTVHAASYVPITAAQARSTRGDEPADSGTAYIDPTGWGDTWGLVPGDQIEFGGVRYGVVSVAAHVIPRTGRLSHIEARVG